MILKISDTPTPVVFREGYRGERQRSDLTQKEDTRHFVNQYRGTSDIIYLPDAAQEQLEKLAPRNSETVLLSKAKIRGRWEWSVKLAEESDAAEPAPQAAAPARPTQQPRIEPAEGELKYAFYPEEAAAAGPQPAANMALNLHRSTGEYREPAIDTHERREQDGTPTRSEDGGHRISARPIPAQLTAAPKPDNARPEAKVLAGALMTAIDALRATADYARAREIPFAFDTQDIRTLGITMYIEHCKQRAAQAGSERRAS